MGISLSILICTLSSRRHFLDRLVSRFAPTLPTEVLVNDRADLKIGKKRNDLIAEATGEYVAFIDDDDLVSGDYFSLIGTALEKKPDCVGIRGIITFAGSYPRMFTHSLQCSGWYNSDHEYFRTPNHLNPIRREIASMVPFNPMSNYGEDVEYSGQIKPFLKTEAFIDKPIYYYLYKRTLGETERAR